MTKAEREAYRPVFEAWVDGELQHMINEEWVDWTTRECPAFCYPPSNYRRRPKPLECWAVVDKDGVLIESYAHKGHADRHAALIGGCRVVHMQEVKGE